MEATQYSLIVENLIHSFSEALHSNCDRKKSRRNIRHEQSRWHHLEHRNPAQKKTFYGIRIAHGKIQAKQSLWKSA